MELVPRENIYGHRQRLFWLRDHLQLEDRVVEFGCGTGRLAGALAEEARAKVWCLDASAEMVTVARETLPPAVGVRRGSAEQLPFRDGWFDRVTMSLVVHLLVPDPAPTATAAALSAPPTVGFVVSKAVGNAVVVVVGAVMTSPPCRLSLLLT